MSDAAARRRAKILAQRGDRMKLVSGLGAAIAQEGKDEETAATTAAAVGPAGRLAADGEGGKATAPEGTCGSETGGVRALNRRRLQARNILLSTATLAAADSVQKEQQQVENSNLGDTNVAASAEASSCSPSPRSPSSPPHPTVLASMALTASATLTTGGNTLRKRYHASRGDNDDIVEKTTTKNGSTTLRVGPPSPPSLLKTLTASDAMVRFWLLCLAGVISGIWITVLNATFLADLRMQAQRQQQYEARAALDEFVAKASPSLHFPPSESGGGGSTKRLGWLAWFHGLFLPEAFDSLPLPILALVWHGVALISMMALRSGGAANASLQGAWTEAGQEDPLLGEGESYSNKGFSGSGSVGGDGGSPGESANRSIVETVASSLGLGWVLEGWKVAQTAWQDVLIFSFFFLLAVAACA
ncbi:Hypothetical protein NocV09_00402090 [Nannochloropsis oceanica]